MFCKETYGRTSRSDSFKNTETVPSVMMPRKKLEYYAKQNGIEDFAKIRLTEDECAEICEAAGVRVYGLGDCGGSVSRLIDCVMDDEDFRASNSREGVSEDYNAARIPDYAAAAVFRALAQIRSR